MKKPLNEIFFQVPIIKDEVNKVKINKSYQELEDFIKNQGISFEDFFCIGDINEKDLSKKFNKKFLKDLAEFLGYKFDDLFIDVDY